ncbi:ABC transporter substrate-binding protein [Roseovarius sp. S1116L3]|uniref:ABC transporter substrate-binding protein n=1 Tax=Roseovarius roseus TaxID=3342636 RepID=UPI00372CDA72
MTTTGRNLTRRKALTTLAGGAAALPLWARYTHAQTAEPIKIGFQIHRTGVGAAYGRWYERTGNAAAKFINDNGGINGRMVELVPEDDGTNPKRGAELIEKFANQHKCDIVYGPLFSHVVIGSAPRAGELKMPYFLVSEGHHVASGMLNRYTIQPGITDVKSQVLSVAPFVAENLGKKVTMIYPDYAFGHDHRDYFSQAIEEQGGEILAQIAIPPTETSFTRHFPKIPRETEVVYHVMVGPSVLTFVKEMGEFFGGSGPELFGFVDSLEAIDIGSPGLDFLEGSHFWEGMCRYAQPDQTEAQAFYRAAVGVNDEGAAIDDPRDVSAYGHMFGCWTTLSAIKMGMESAGYRGPQDRAALIEAVEAMTDIPHSREWPQGPMRFNGRTHQVFSEQHVSRVENGRLVRVHTAGIDAGLYPDEVDYTQQPF